MLGFSSYTKFDYINKIMSTVDATADISFKREKIESWNVSESEDLVLFSSISDQKDLFLIKNIDPDITFNEFSTMFD